MLTTSGPRVHNAGSVERVPLGEARTVTVAGQAVAIVRTRSDEVYAVQADCPHQGGPLADGLVGGGRIVCPLHSHAFDLATGESLRSGCPALRTYRVAVSSAGELLLTLPSEGEGHG